MLIIIIFVNFISWKVIKINMKREKLNCYVDLFNFLNLNIIFLCVYPFLNVYVLYISFVYWGLVIFQLVFMRFIILCILCLAQIDWLIVLLFNHILKELGGSLHRFNSTVFNSSEICELHLVLLRLPEGFVFRAGYIKTICWGDQQTTATPS